MSYEIQSPLFVEIILSFFPNWSDAFNAPGHWAKRFGFFSPC